MHNIEIKKKIVLAGGSKIFKNWSEHSSITQSEFISALEWLCEDPCDGGTSKTRVTRGIGLTPTGLVKLRYHYDSDLTTIYELDSGALWVGAMFPVTDAEQVRVWGVDGKCATQMKIGITCRDRI